MQHKKSLKRWQIKPSREAFLLIRFHGSKIFYNKVINFENEGYNKIEN
jgi:hypothetical protein